MRRRRVLWPARSFTSIILIISWITRTGSLRSVVAGIVVVGVGLGLGDVGEVGLLDTTATVEGEGGDEEKTDDD